MQNRRAFVRGAVAAGVFLAGAPAAAAAGGPLDGASSEVDVLARLLEIEQTVVFAYRHVVGSVRLSPPGASTVRRFLGQELVHARTVAGELSRRGRKVPAPPTSVQAVDGTLAVLGVHERLEQVHTESGALKLLVGVETVEENAFHDAVVKLSSGEVARLAAQILTCEAQQWTVLTGIAHRGNVQRAVPHAFVPLAAELKA